MEHVQNVYRTSSHPLMSLLNLVEMSPSQWAANMPFSVDKRRTSLSIYDQKPKRFLQMLHQQSENPHSRLYCAGFELGTWRCHQFAFHLAEWLPDYALPEDELRIDHGNVLVKLNQAAIRVYTSPKYASRGEAGEIALHAVCREFFGTIPLSPRVFYKSASNDVVKAFDLVHVRFPDDAPIEIWLGESKLYKSAKSAISDAITSIKSHVDGGFLSNQKLLLGPQIPKSTPHYEDIIQIFSKQESLDTLLKSAVFVIGILCNSDALSSATTHDEIYINAAAQELADIEAKLTKSGLATSLRLTLIYIPLSNKVEFVNAFDKRLKGLQ